MGRRVSRFEGVQQFFTRLFGTIDSQLAVEEFVDVGDKVIVIGFSRGQVRAWRNV